MTVIGLCSTKHSPGTTTSALAIGLALAETQRVVVIEADRAGGDLAAMCGLRVDPSLVSFAAGARHTSPVDIESHLQRIGALRLLTAPAPHLPSLDVPALASISAARSLAELVLVDLGRVDFVNRSLLEACDHVVVTLRPTLTAVEHVRARAESFDIHRTSSLIIGDRPYSPHQVDDALTISNVGVLPFSDRDVEVLLHKPMSRAARRCALLGAAGQIGTYLLSAEIEERRLPA